MIEALRERSEAATILFDLPPAFASDDAMIILEQLDGYVLVVDSGKTTRRHVQDVLGMLQPTPCIGSILNRYRGGLGDSYGYRSEEHTSELQSLMRISYAVFCLKQKT